MLYTSTNQSSEKPASFMVDDEDDRDANAAQNHNKEII